jgi:hypothetical protein
LSVRLPLTPSLSPRAGRGKDTRRSRGRVRGGFLALAGFVALTAPALANDSTAELDTGGLVFVHNDDIEMRSEVLSVTLNQIQVTYHFFNKSNQPVTDLVAFPLPDIVVDSPDWNVAVPTQDPVNFLGFTTTVNGQPVATQVQQRVFAQGLDQTALLQQLGVPLAPQLQATDNALDALPQDKWQQLIALGMGEIVEYGTTTMQKHLQPLWGLRTTYYWQQTFAPGQETVIQHQYKPSVGSSVGTMVGMALPSDPQGAADIKKQVAAYTAKYCMDASFIAAATRAYQAAQKANTNLGERRIDYILTTGGNWAGPIADFTLTIDKGDPNSLISFCGNGVKKLSPTQFQVHYTNYTPTTDLAILILTSNTAQ